MAVAYGTVSGSGLFVQTTFASSLSIASTNFSGTDVLLVAQVEAFVFGTAAISSVQWDVATPENFTQQYADENNNASSFYVYTHAAGSGATDTVTANFPSSRDQISLITSSFTGVDQTTPIKDSGTGTHSLGYNTPETFTITLATAAADEMIASVTFTDGTGVSYTTGTNQTQAYDDDAGPSYAWHGRMEYKDGADGNTATISTDNDSNGSTVLHWAALFNDAGGGGGGTTIPLLVNSYRRHHQQHHSG